MWTTARKSASDYVAVSGALDGGDYPLARMCQSLHSGLDGVHREHDCMLSHTGHCSSKKMLHREIFWLPDHFNDTAAIQEEESSSLKGWLARKFTRHDNFRDARTQDQQGMICEKVWCPSSSTRHKSGTRGRDTPSCRHHHQQLL